MNNAADVLFVGNFMLYEIGPEYFFRISNSFGSISRDSFVFVQLASLKSH